MKLATLFLMTNPTDTTHATIHPMPTPCDICPKARTLFGADSLGHVYSACADHEKYLPGWIADADHESACDSVASARYEERAYGHDDDY